jgi:hypothetical protein
MASTIILRKFTWLRDYRSILWKETLWYNFERNFAAGIICGIFMALLGEGLQNLYIYPLMWPFAYAFIAPILFLLCKILARMLPIMNSVLALLAILFVSIGDPIVCILSFINPKLVPVSRPPLFSTNLVFWVLDADSETAIAGDIFSNQTNVIS